MAGGVEGQPQSGQVGSPSPTHGGCFVMGHLLGDDGARDEVDDTLKCARLIYR
jgi:hypothetical protein